jgi:paraquat-inducible protein B
MEARYYRVGLFVFLGMLAIVAAIITLGGRGLFQDPLMFETYFEESVQGLEVGSAVMFRGVPLGTVSGIGLVSEYYELGDEERLKYGNLVRVKMRLVPRSDRGVEPGEATREMRDFLPTWVEQGLRLQLSKAAITNTAVIEADYVDAARNPPMQVPWTPHYLYIPSRPSTFAEISSAADRLIQRIDRLQVEELVADVSSLVRSLNQAVENLDVPHLRKEGSSLLVDLRLTSEALRHSLEEVDVPQLAGNAREALEGANAAMGQLEGMVSGSRYDLEVTLENLRVTTDSLRDVTETLRQQPSLLLRSRPPTSVEGESAP